MVAWTATLDLARDRHPALLRWKQMELVISILRNHFEQNPSYNEVLIR